MLSFKRNGAPFLWNGCADFAEYAVDNEQGDVSTEKLGKRDIDFYEHTELITAVWIEDGYFFKLTYYGNVSQEEVKDIILSIK